MQTLKFIYFFISALFIISTNLYAQNIGINPTGATPNSSAMLDVSATDKGMLIPRVSLTSMSDVTTITNPATSLLVYNTNAGLSNGSVGFYYWNGMVWVKLSDGSVNSANNFWTANGNHISNANSGHVGIGTTSPTTPLHVKGQQAITLPNGGVETSNVTALINDTTTSSGTGSKIGLYSIVKNHSAANVGVLAEAITKDSTNNFGIIGNIIGSGQTGGMAYAIGAVDAVKNGTGALYIDGQARYAGVYNTNTAGTVITNSGNGTMEWSVPIVFRSTGINNTNIATSSNAIPQFVTPVYGGANTTFTATTKGIYHFDCSLLVDLGTLSNNGYIEVSLERNGLAFARNRVYIQAFSNTTLTLPLSADIDLLIGESVNVRFTNSSNTTKVIHGDDTQAYFSGHLIR